MRELVKIFWRVEDAFAINPPVKATMVEVETIPVYAVEVKSNPPPPEPQAAPAAETTPFASVWTQRVPTPPSAETVKLVVDAVPFTEKRAAGFAVPTPTKPEGSTLKSEVVALPDGLVEEAMSKRARPETCVRWMPNCAKGVVVPDVKEVLKSC